MGGWMPVAVGFFFVFFGGGEEEQKRRGEGGEQRDILRANF